MVGVAQLAARELRHPRLFLPEQLEVTGSFFRVELGMFGGVGRPLVRSLRPFATAEDPPQEPHGAYSIRRTRRSNSKGRTRTYMPDSEPNRLDRRRGTNWRPSWPIDRVEPGRGLGPQTVEPPYG